MENIYIFFCFKMEKLDNAGGILGLQSARAWWEDSIWILGCWTIIFFSWNQLGFALIMPFDLTQTMGDSKMCQAHPFFFPSHFFPPQPHPTFEKFPTRRRGEKRRFPEMYFLDRHSLIVFECHIVWACMGEGTLNDVECFMAPCLCVNPSPVLLWDSDRRGSSAADGSDDQGVTQSRS